MAAYVGQVAEEIGVDLAVTPLHPLTGLEDEIHADVERRLSEGETPQLGEYHDFIVMRLRRFGARRPQGTRSAPGAASPARTAAPRSPTAGPGGGPPPPPPVPPGTPSEIAARRARQAQEYLDIANELEGQGLSQAAAAQAWRQRAAMARDLAAKAHNQLVEAYNGALAAEQQALKDYEAAADTFDRAATPRDRASAKKKYEAARRELERAQERRRRLDAEYKKSKKVLDELDEKLKPEETEAEDGAAGQAAAAGQAPAQNLIVGGAGEPQIFKLSLAPDYFGPPPDIGLIPGGGPTGLAVMPGGMPFGDGTSLPDDCIKIIRDCAKKLQAGAAPNSAVALLAGMAQALAAAATPCPPCDKCRKEQEADGTDDAPADARSDQPPPGQAAQPPQPPQQPQQPPQRPAPQGAPQPTGDPTRAPGLPQRTPQGPARQDGTPESSGKDNGTSATPAGSEGPDSKGPATQREPSEPFRLRDPVAERAGKRDEKLDYQRWMALKSFVSDNHLNYTVPSEPDYSDGKVFDAERLKLRRMHLATMARRLGLTEYRVNDSWDLLDDRVYDHHKRLVIDMGHTRARAEQRKRAAEEFERMGSIDRLGKGFSEALDTDELSDELASQLRGLLTPEALAAMLGFFLFLTGVSALTGGSILPIIAATVGPTLVPLVLGMYHLLTADTIEEFEIGVGEIQRAIVTGGITLFTAALFRMGGAALSKGGGRGGATAPRPTGGGPRPVRTPANGPRPALNGTGGGRLGGRLSETGPPRTARPGITTNGTHPPTVPEQPLPRINGAMRVNPPRSASRLPPGRGPSTVAGGRLPSGGGRLPPSTARPGGTGAAGAPRPAAAVPGSGAGGTATAVRTVPRTTTRPAPRPVRPVPEPAPAATPGGLATGARAAARIKPKPASNATRPLGELAWRLVASIVAGLNFGGGIGLPPFRGWELPHGDDDFTQGVFRDADNPNDEGTIVGSTRSDRELTPERRARVDETRQRLVDEGYTDGELASVDRALRHAEGEAVGMLRSGKVKRGLLDINNSYICKHCISALRWLVPKGKELIVRFATPGGRKVSVRFRNGEPPQILNRNGWQDMLGGAEEIEAFLLALDAIGGSRG